LGAFNRRQGGSAGIPEKTAAIGVPLKGKESEIVKKSKKSHKGGRPLEGFQRFTLERERESSIWMEKGRATAG